MTADCDLRNRKHASLLTLVPLVTTQVALEHYILPDDLQRKLPLIETYLLKELAAEGGEGRDSKLDVLRAMPADEISALPSPKRVALEAIRGSLSFVSKADYTKLMPLIGGKVPGWTSFRDQLRAKGDLLVLPHLRDFDVPESVAWVRPLWQIPLADVALRTSEIATKRGERVARLASPFRYRLTQLLAQVFSDIGLPSTPDDIDSQIEDFFNAP